MVYLPNTNPTEYSPYFIMPHHVQFFAGGYLIKPDKLAYKDSVTDRPGSPLRQSQRSNSPEY